MKMDWRWREQRGERERERETTGQKLGRGREIESVGRTIDDSSCRKVF